MWLEITMSNTAPSFTSWLVCVRRNATFPVVLATAKSMARESGSMAVMDSASPSRAAHRARLSAMSPPPQPTSSKEVFRSGASSGLMSC